MRINIIKQLNRENHCFSLFLNLISMILKVLQVIDGYAFPTQTYPILLWENIEDSIFNCRSLLLSFTILYFILSKWLCSMHFWQRCLQTRQTRLNTDERKSMPTFSHHSFYAIFKESKVSTKKAVSMLLRCVSFRRTWRDG